jgi:hypothetical protein
LRSKLHEAGAGARERRYPEAPEVGSADVYFIRFFYKLY